MKLFHFILIKKPISIIIRDVFIRIGLILSGILASYSLGANNTATLIGPYLSVCKEVDFYQIIILICLSITLGFLMANKSVIQTVSSRLFLLSPLEAFIVMLSSSVSLLCFSSKELYHILTWFHLPTFPLVPVPMTCVIIGSICGISVSRGGYGLHFSVLARIITSWFLVPFLSGCLCYSFLIISDILG
jgi:phosphate/sulfate permease